MRFVRSVVGEFVDALRKGGWDIQLAAFTAELTLCERIRQRYSSLDTQHLDFLRSVRTCIDRDRVTWFLSADDYNETSAWPIRWNEWELHAVEVSAGRKHLVDSI